LVQVDWRWAHVELARFGLGEIKDVVDPVHQAQRVALGALDLGSPVLRRGACRRELLQRGENERQGGAQFVTDRGNEITLGLIGRLGLVARLNKFDGLRLQHLGLTVQRVRPLGDHPFQRGLDLLSFGFGLGLQ
jgi:hypothetical protein